MKWFAIFILLFCLPSLAIADATDFCETWETTNVGNLTTGASSAQCSGNTNWTCHYPDIPDNRPARIQVVTSPVRAGDKAVMLENRPTETWLAPYSRTDLQSRHGSVDTTWEGWLAISIYDNSAACDDAFIVQMHHSGSGSPPLMPLRYYTDNYLRTVHYYGTDPDNKTTRTYCDSGCTVTATLGSWASFTGEWHDLVWHIKYDPTAPLAGTYEMWIDGVQKISQVGTVGIGYSSAPYNTNYLVLSLYRGSTGPNMLEYFDEIRRRTTADGGSYGTVCPTIHPKAPSSPTYDTVSLSGATGVPLSFTLAYNAYVAGYDVTDTARAHIQDLAGDFVHYDSDFEISTSSATISSGAFTPTSVVWSSTTDVGILTQASVTGLSENTTYWVHARYRNMAWDGSNYLDRDFDGNAPPGDQDDMYYGPWSTPVSFTTIASGGGGGGGGGVAAYMSLGGGAGSGSVTVGPAGSGSMTITNP